MSRRFSSIAAFVAFMQTRPAAAEAASQEGLRVVGRLFVRECVALIGQEVESWAPLAAATVIEKQRLGYVDRMSPTDPLYRRGDLRLSFSFDVRPRGVGFGSGDPVMLFHEWGTVRMPARPVVGPVLMHNTLRATDLVANYVAGAVAGLDRPLRPISRQDEGDA